MTPNHYLHLHDVNGLGEKVTGRVGDGCAIGAARSESALVCVGGAESIAEVLFHGFDDAIGEYGSNDNGSDFNEQDDADDDGVLRIQSDQCVRAVSYWLHTKYTATMTQNETTTKLNRLLLTEVPIIAECIHSFYDRLCDGRRIFTAIGGVFLELIFS